MIQQNTNIQSPLLKISDGRLQSPSPYNTSSIPSLVVSVPLSNATVPGVNLPPNSNSPLAINMNQNQSNYQSSSTSASSSSSSQRFVSDQQVKNNFFLL